MNARQRRLHYRHRRHVLMLVVNRLDEAFDRLYRTYHHQVPKKVFEAMKVEIGAALTRLASDPTRKILVD